MRRGWSTDDGVPKLLGEGTYKIILKEEGEWGWGMMKWTEEETRGGWGV